MEEEVVQVGGISYLVRGDAVRLLKQWLKDNSWGAAAVGTNDGYMWEVDEARKHSDKQTRLQGDK